MYLEKYIYKMQLDDVYDSYDFETNKIVWIKKWQMVSFVCILVQWKMKGSNCTEFNFKLEFIRTLVLSNMKSVIYH